MNVVNFEGLFMNVHKGLFLNTFIMLTEYSNRSVYNVCVKNIKQVKLN